MFHVLAYEASLAISASDADLSRVVDPSFTSRGTTDFIFTEPYNLLAAYYQSADATRARFDVPLINGIGRHQIWPIERSATIPDRPGIQDYRDMPLALPENESIIIEGSHDNGAAVNQANAFLWIAGPAWNRNIPRGLQRLMIRATASPTAVINAWSGDAAITFADNLRGGWYSVVGMQVFDAGCLAARLNFRNGNVVNGRKLYPGCLGTEALGNTPSEMFVGGLGLWGRFHSFEPPSIQVLNTASGATTSEIRLDVVYHGDTYRA